MRKYTIAALLLTAAQLSAQSPTATEHWQAQWVWLPSAVEAEMMLARKVFSLPEVPRKALLSITAGSRYQLFLNGNYVGMGPARCAPHHQSYDVIDVTKSLAAGENVLAVRVHFQRAGVSYYEHARAGLLAQLECSWDDRSLTIPSDASWRVELDASWKNESPPMARFHLEVCDRVDLRQRLDGWKDVGFDDRKWSQARVLKREVGWPATQPNDRPRHLIPPWTSLVPRDIPLLREATITASTLVQATSIRGPEGETHFGQDKWINAADIGSIVIPSREQPAPGNPMTIAANEKGKCRAVIYDLGEVTSGRPFVEIQGPAGAVVDVMCAPYLLDRRLPSPVVVSKYVDRIALSGRRDRWNAVYMKPTRWLALVFRHLPAEAELFSTGVIASEYPFVQKGSFQTPDAPDLERLWQAAVKTIQVCTTDAYTDNYRERRQYAQTAYYACLGNYPVFGDTALQRQYLTQIADEQLPNGIMPAYAPRHGNDFMVILDSNCFWIRGLHQYLLYSGDGSTTRSLLPAARRLLGLLHSFTNDHGLIDSPPYAYWLDHALNDRRGVNVCLNGHYLGALEDFAQVLQWLDEPDADIYRKRAALVRQTLGARAWDPERQLFADAVIDGQRSDEFSEHANAMAMALRVATPQQMSAVAAQLSHSESHDFVRRASRVVMVTPAMSHFLHAGLCEAGYADQSWNLLRTRFAHMLSPSGNGTLWEEWWLDGTGRSGTLRPIASGRSDAQTESAFFPGLFARYILGIEPTQPGLRDVVLRYYPSDQLPRRRGAVPTPSGMLGVGWKITPSQFEISLQVPTDTTVRVDLASLQVTSAESILLDDKAVSPQTSKDGFLVISEGDHTVLIKRM